jgi:hypothetical protein
MQGRRTSDAMQPLVFAILRALTPPDVEVVVYDERVEPIPLDERTDLVAMTVETYTARRALQLATAYRRRRVPVVMGAYHPTFLPEECAAFADAIAFKKQGMRLGYHEHSIHPQCPGPLTEADWGQSRITATTMDFASAVR